MKACRRIEVRLHLFLIRARGKSWKTKLAHQSNYSGIKSRNLGVSQSLGALQSLAGRCIEEMKPCSCSRLNPWPSRQIPWEFSCNDIRLRHPITLLWYNRWHPIFIRYTNSLWQRILMQYHPSTGGQTITWDYKPRTVHKMGLATSNEIV